MGLLEDLGNAVGLTSSDADHSGSGDFKHGLEHGIEHLAPLVIGVGLFLGAVNIISSGLSGKKKKR